MIHTVCASMYLVVKKFPMFIGISFASMDVCTQCCIRIKSESIIELILLQSLEYEMILWLQISGWQFDDKVEKILKGSLDLIPSPSLQWKFKLWAGKFAWVVEAKHCWALSTNFWKQKNCWHHPAMICLYTSSNLNFH